MESVRESRTSSCRLLFLGLWILAGSPGEAEALQGMGATVVGRVLDAETGAPIAGAMVTVEGSELRALSGEDGYYRIEPVPPGPQVLEVRRLGYAPARVLLTVLARGLVERDVHLAVSALQLEGLTVTADPAGRARGELGTATVVGGEAIRAQSAASLAGILELVPGSPLMVPGLDQIQQATLRSAPVPAGPGTALGPGLGASALAAFGTLIVVDGVPLSNNANLQAGGLFFPTTVGGGIDLRRIPAATIERVEVIRGIPSARYGDLTHGAILVETRAGALSTNLATRLDQRTIGSSLTGGWGVGGPHVLSVSGDATRTRVAPGITLDYATRYTVQAAHRANWGGMIEERDRVTADTRLDIFQTVENRPENPDLVPGRASWVRDRGIRLSHRLRIADPQGHLHLQLALDRGRQRAYSQRELTRSAMPFTGRMTEGRGEAEYVIGRFLAWSEVHGQPWFLFGRAERERTGGWFGASHRLRGGFEFRREWNAGQGLSFDPRFPPQITYDGLRGHSRPRSLAEIPPLMVSALYLDDRITRDLGALGALNVQAGVRAEVLHEGGGLFDRLRDVVAQPRVNVEFLPAPWLRLRSGWGRTAKAPSLLQLHPPPEYYDLVNVNWFTTDEAERLAVMTTFIRDGTNPELGFAVARLAEAGVEAGFRGGEGALSLTVFRETVSDAVGARALSGWIPRERFQLADSTIGDGRPPEIIEPAYRADTIPILVRQSANNMEVTSEGIELVASLPEIRQLRTRFQVQGALTWSRVISGELDYGPRDRFTDFQRRSSPDRIPFWAPGERRGELGIVTYRAVHHQPHLGLVVTATVQHDLYQRDRHLAEGDSLSWIGYLTRTGERVLVSPEDRHGPEFTDLRAMTRPLTPSLRSAPADWIMGLQVTKTLPAEGRISFWAFNLFENMGYFGSGGGSRPRVYPGMRFGLEMIASPGALLPW